MKVCRLPQSRRRLRGVDAVYVQAMPSTWICVCTPAYVFKNIFAYIYAPAYLLHTTHVFEFFYLFYFMPPYSKNIRYI
jgi:hypothetical protein